MRLNIPNLLTLLRIALIPVFVVCFYLPMPWAPLAASALFAMAAVTDWLDGYLARRMGETSAFGAFLDPVADKLMVVTALVLLIDQNPTDIPGFFLAVPAAVIIGREIAVSALREWMAEVGAGKKVAVSMVGKFKTTAQMIAILLLLYRAPLFDLPTVTFGMALLYIAAILTLWSMFLYLNAAWPDLSGNKQTSNGQVDNKKCACKMGASSMRE